MIVAYLYNQIKNMKERMLFYQTCLMLVEKDNKTLCRTNTMRMKH